MTSRRRPTAGRPAARRHTGGRLATVARVAPVARVAAVGAVAAAVLAGAGSLGRPTPGMPTTGPTGAPDAPGASVAVEDVTLTCPGDPFVGEGRPAGGEAPPDVEGLARLAEPDPAVLDGVVEPPDDPGEASIDPGGSADESDPPGVAGALGSDPVTVRGTGARASGLVAAQTLAADGAGEDDVQGLAATPCAEPAADLWLTAGGPEPGRQERLVLTNPGGNPVSVDVTFLTADGPAEPGAGQDVVVAPGGRTVLPLDALSGTRTAQVVHVQAIGGRVTAAVSDTWRDGLTPSGLDLVGPTAAPATRLTLPANVDGTARGLLLGTPGGQDAVVDVRAVGEDRARSVTVETVPAGGLAEVSLPEAPGVHTWVVESDEPVVAGTWTRSDAARGGVRDVSWSVATPSVGRVGGAALPVLLEEGTRCFVEVVGQPEGGSPVEAELFVQEGGATERQTVRVEPGRSRAVNVCPATAVWLRTESEGVHAAVLLTDPGGARLASLPLLPVPLTVRDVPVAPAAD